MNRPPYAPNGPPGYPTVSFNLESPSLVWRSASYQTLLTVATLCRGFLFGLNKTEVHGLPRFLELLKSRADPSTRQRGLVTVSNHVSVMDDPLIWGVLPFSFHAYHGYLNHRWGFGSHDICFKGTLLSHFFTLGQVLPTHRLAHSVHGGPMQPSLTEAIRLLSPIQKISYTPRQHGAFSDCTSHPPSWPRDAVDPFSDTNIDPQSPHYASYTDDERLYLAPSRYRANQLGWVHIFPEGMIHQSPNYNMRYFKWGVARLILEPAVCPDVVPIWIEGTDQVMHESREFPRFIPRPGNRISVTFGEAVDPEARFGDLRQRWQQLQNRWIEEADPGATKADKELTLFASLGMGMQGLSYSAEVLELWIETTLRVREEVLRLRRDRGWPDEDPKASVAETWVREGPKRQGQMEDGTWVGDT
ncbi:uncharacterized protein HMPREF1541_05297 [Cyphellophora europaea CBS 101466]|uniref:Tafazzin family protein n=1 Tax=Cyphellophora europaea (strain CBS 101466) TaxID=1220924 RepID=W2RRY7_CYPE1|nr:uncharacterized protein HMPREF1541_05297 [Cyphellophora europaea CBS 101466]ETN39075.1 hypothetical protein HMPREF1541_05297 [Cyphellophora europaea CBS 101466]